MSITADSNALLCRFISDYAGWLLGCGATCIRLEKNLRRIGRAYGMDVEFTITPHHVHLSLIPDDGSPAVTMIASARPVPTSFSIISDLSTLSWEIADRHINLDEACRRFRQIVSSDRQSSLAVLLLVAIANASFCRLFGGDPVAMAVVGVATLAGYWLKLLLLKQNVDLRVTFMICAFVSTVLGATDSLFSLGTTPAIAIGTSILYLVPGVPFLNSFSDMLYRYYICSFSRLMDALVLTGSLSIGLCCGMMAMGVGMF